MRAIHHKLLRDLFAMWAQALAIALVISSGVATFVMSLSTMNALQETQTSFYQDYRFADVFASLKRAPQRLTQRIANIDGVREVETRVMAPVNLDIAGFSDPVTGLLVSIPDQSQPLLNRLYLRQGRLPEPGQNSEVVISEAFAAAHEFKPGVTLRAIINGHRKILTVVGIAVSPDYIYQVQPGGVFPDYKRYGILWMGRTPLASAYDMEGAFNDVVLTLYSGALLADVIVQLDEILERYGGIGAYGRSDQLTHRFLTSEFQQLQTMATLFPVIFLGVAAFLLNVVVSRLISLQREQIAALKAFGYRNWEVGWHYLQLVMLIVVLGLIIGVAGGVWLGQGLSTLYMETFRFPYLNYSLSPGTVSMAALISLIAAASGTLYAVLLAVRLPPAEAMRPEPPARFKETWVEHWGLKNNLSQPTRMILRNIERRPVKAFLTMLGISFACAILVVGSFQEDAIDYMVTVQFDLAQRDDISVTFVEPASRRALHELNSLPGVDYAEPFRAVAVRLRNQHYSYRTAIQGFSSTADLQRLLDTELRRIELPEDGILLNDYLAEILAVRPGDRLLVEVLEGKRVVREVSVAGLVSQFFGVTGYMDIAALNRLLREADAISGVYMAIDENYQESIYSTLKEMPKVAGATVQKTAIESFYDTMAENILIFALVNTLLAGTIALGVVYNSARIALSERGRELASLRVLGFTHGEVAYILLGELALLTLLAIPPGFAIGRGLCAYMVNSFKSELYRIPLVTEPSTYAFAATIVLLAALLTGVLIWFRLARLDLIGVLKTKE